MRKKYLIIIMIVFVLSITGCSKSDIKIEKYLDSGTKIDTYAKYFMPNIDALPEYQNISYKYTHNSMVLFESDSIVLVVDYNEKTYNKEKEKLAKKYKFLDEKVVSNYDESKYYIPEYEFSINSYDFKVIDESDNYKAEYPKSFGMIGISDEKKSIAYLYFYDLDLDYIGQKGEKNPMANFVNKYYKYNF